MFKNKVKLYIQSALILLVVCIIAGLKTETNRIGVTHAVGYFKESANTFSLSTLELNKALTLLDDPDSTTIINARAALKKSRLNYKRIEFFLNYFFESDAFIYNKPAKVEVEEPYMEYQEPTGFQVIEALLFDDAPATHQAELLAQAKLVSSSAADLNALLYGFQANDSQVLESVRLELVRVITLSITGYDAPELKSGIEESYQSVYSILQVLGPYFKAESPSALKLKSTLNKTLAYLAAHPDFDRFNRMEFLTDHALPLQEQLRDFIAELHLDLKEKSIFNYRAKNLFSADAILPVSFPEATVATPAKIALGKKLFLETALSGNLKRSCASCHHPDQYFSDGVKTSVAFDGISHVERNAPTLLYAGFQYGQFWDGRAKSLPEQIKAVIANPLEMNGDHQVIISNIKNRKDYIDAFQKAYPKEAGAGITIDRLASALAVYVMGLAPRNSGFDRYLDGDKKAMTLEQVKGFNLFMGKAQCGSCHFAPLFNGLIPPLYQLTEYEILGTPKNDDFEHPEKDHDQGRYGYFPIRYYQGAFKTPTVRNVEKTAPYMHNGTFKDLEKVVQFYNLGGGAGLHLDLPQQTLSAKPLHLTDLEVHEIVVFMQSLTDKLE